MIEDLIAFTNSREYVDYYNIWTTEVSYKKEDRILKIVLELFNDFEENSEKSKQIWEITCEDHWESKGAEQYKRPFNRVKVYREHPALWEFEDSQYFTVIGTCKDIPALMGDLYMAHNKACGNWQDFHREFSGLPEILIRQGENQLAAPVRLFEVHRQVFDKHQVPYRLNQLQKSDKNFSLLLFCNDEFCPDDFYFNQPYVIAGTFKARRL